MKLILVGLIVGRIIGEVSFLEKELKFVSPTIEGKEDYLLPVIDGCIIEEKNGYPSLPLKTVSFFIPEGKEVKNIKIIPTDSVILEGKYNLFPLQPPQVITPPEDKRGKGFKFYPPNEKIYSSKKWYPEELILYKSSGYIYGKKIVTLGVSPLRWNPSTKGLIFYKNLTISLSLTSTKNSSPSPPLPSAIRNLLVSFVENKQNYFPFKGKNYSRYLILTVDSLLPFFDLLCQWKTRSCFPCMLRSVEWVYQNYPGRDQAEAIRNYLKTVLDSGVVWLLIGGDTELIPTRMAYAMSVWGHPHPDDSIPTDLYYSDLDGSWDADKDNIFGEVEDSVDLYPDLIVGRAPVRNREEVEVFIDKVITYEKGKYSYHLTRALFMAEILWHSPYTDASIAKEKIGKLFPENFEITKLYQSKGTENVDTVKTEINKGYALINHDGHGWISSMGVGEGSLHSWDFVENSPLYGILYSIGCWVGRFDKNCIGENWVRQKKGGGVVFIGNSNYGWGVPGMPGYGYSDKLDYVFFENIFKKGITRTGEALAIAKVKFIPYSLDANVWRWHQYMVNLMGDPTIDVWTNTTQEVNICTQNTIPWGETIIKVNTGIGGEEGWVCVQGEKVYEMKEIDQNGETMFQLKAEEESLWVGVRVHNGGVKGKWLQVVKSEKGYPVYWGHKIEEREENYLLSTEKVELKIYVKNCGGEEIVNYRAKLLSKNPNVVIVDSIIELGTIFPSQIKEGKTIIRTTNCRVGELVRVIFKLDEKRVENLDFVVKGQRVEYFFYGANKQPQPMDSLTLWVMVKNYLKDTEKIGVKIIPVDARVKVLEENYKEIQLKKVMKSNGIYGVPYRIKLQTGACGCVYIPIEIEIKTEEEAIEKDTLWLKKMPKLGESFFDDFEEDYSMWYHKGKNDLWHRTSHRKASGKWSWYCGDSTKYQYPSDMDCYLANQYFYVGEESWLSFMCYYRLPTFGEDGLSVILVKEGKEDTLDFLGAGGALSKGFTCGWAKYQYKLEKYHPTDMVQIKFGFNSIQGGEEGVYIDDVRVGEEKETKLFICGMGVNGEIGVKEIGIGEEGEVSVWVVNSGNEKIVNERVRIKIREEDVKLKKEEVVIDTLYPKIVKKVDFPICVKNYSPNGEIEVEVVAEDTLKGRIKIKLGIEEIIKRIVKISPNPSRGTINFMCRIQKGEILKLKIYDVVGRKVEEMEMKTRKLVWFPTGIRSGVYFVKFYVNDTLLTIRKLVLFK